MYVLYSKKDDSGVAIAKNQRNKAQAASTSTSTSTRGAVQLQSHVASLHLRHRRQRWTDGPPNAC